MDNDSKKRDTVTIEDIKKSTKQAMHDIGDGIEQLAAEIKTAFKGRNHTLMVRTDGETLERIDELVDTNLFSSRSEAAAFLLHEGIKRQESLFSKLQDGSEKIKNIRDAMKCIIARELKEYKKQKVRNV